MFTNFIKRFAIPNTLVSKVKTNYNYLEHISIFITKLNNSTTKLQIITQAVIAGKI
jgi:hypothetical protein